MPVIERAALLQVGSRAEIIGPVTAKAVKAFALWSKDGNPLHYDKDYAENTRFGIRIVQGMLVANFISGALAALAGKEMTIILLSQTLEYRRPSKVGDMIRAIAEVIAINTDGSISASTICRNQLDKVVIDGEATFLADPYPCPVELRRQR